MLAEKEELQGGSTNVEVSGEMLALLTAKWKEKRMPYKTWKKRGKKVAQ